MKLSVLVPARDEEDSIEAMLSSLTKTLRRERIEFEVVVVNDGSTDATESLTRRLSEDEPSIKVISNPGPHGFGSAVRFGLRHYSGGAVAVMMADGSDSPDDLVAYYRRLQTGDECVLGSRFIKGGKIIGYPIHKLVLNRLANWFIRVIFGIRYNDVTNPFKAYRREVIDGMSPLMSRHFNLTVEMPLKAIVRGYKYSVIPITWINRTTGISKLKIREMGSRYLFIVLCLWLEKYLSRGDYDRSMARPTLEKHV